jgi:uncharacterized membrane protein
MFHLGRDCLCRREAPTLGRFTFPLCWRCTGIAVGIAALQAVDCLGGLQGFPASLAAPLGALCGLPAAADVFCQMAGPYRSDRRRRLATGVLLGAGVVFLARAFVPLIRGYFP